MKSLELLRQLLHATRAGRMSWLHENPAVYQAEIAEMKCAFRFKRPLLAGDNGSDADAVEVTVDKTALVFYSGTEGFNLVGEILSEAYPEIRSHNELCAVNIDKAIERISKSLS